MTVVLRSFVAFAIPTVMVLTSVGCASLSRGKCKSCESNQVYSVPSQSFDQPSGGYSAPLSMPAPIPVPESELDGIPVPPPPMGAARPNAIQTMRGATTSFFRTANENVRNTFRR